MFHILKHRWYYFYKGRSQKLESLFAVLTITKGKVHIRVGVDPSKFIDRNNVTKTHKRSTFGVAKKKPIGVKVTLRGRSAHELLLNFLRSRDNKLLESMFDTSGNFSFGIAEYINIPGIKYDPDIGIMGMDVCVTLSRPGFRIAKRMIKPKKIGKKHRISKEEAIGWAEKTLKVEVVKRIE